MLVLGLRGIDVQGGIESHARKLYPLLARLGCTVEVVQRTPYIPRDRRRGHWHGLKLTYFWSPTTPGMETAVHTLLGVLYAAVRRPDVLHLHAIGPGLLAPLARVLGLRVVMTHHGADYRREKWGPLARTVLRAGERIGVRSAHRPIAVAPDIQEDLTLRLGVDVELIPNGAPTVPRATGRTTLERFGLEPGRYVLNVARLDPTKRQDDLIAAFLRADVPGLKLALVGAGPDNAYCAGIRRRAAADTRVVLTGFQSGPALRELYSHAGLFALPSSLEGHPIALLEAASYGLPIIASAIPPNLALPLPRDRFFPVGDVAALATLLERAAGEIGAPAAAWEDLRRHVRQRFSWRRAAQLTRSVYDEAAGRRRRHGGEQSHV